MKKFLFSTVLTAAVAVSMVAAAADTPAPAKTKVAHKTAHAKKAHKKHDDAYKPSAHKKEVKKVEEVILFADANKHVAEKHKPQDALVNSDGLSVKVGGKVDIQYGVIDQKSEFKHPANNSSLSQSDDIGVSIANTAPSAFTNQNAMTSNGELNFTAEKEVQGNKYGAQLTVNANTSPTSGGNANVASGVSLFMENSIGRFEAGAIDGASEDMAISGATIAKGTGGIDGDYSNWIPYKALSVSGNQVLDNIFIDSPTLPFDANSAKKANKLNYYTPTVNGFKAGLSYVRDSTVQGTTFEALDFKGTGYKNVFELGLSYEHKVNNMSFAISATGKTGEARDAAISGENPTTIALKKLAAWQVGGKVSYDAFTVATSYGDWGKSGTQELATATTPKRQQKFWTAGLAYDHQDKGGVSLTYMGSQRRGAFSLDALPFITPNQTAYDNATNKFESFVLGMEYKVMPGLMPYAEVATFKYKSPLVDSKLITANKGTIVLGGVKLNF